VAAVLGLIPSFLCRSSRRRNGFPSWRRNRQERGRPCHSEPEADIRIEADGFEGSAEPPRVAEALRAALARADWVEITAGTLVESFGTGAFGLLLILLNLPNVVFAPPVLAGIAAVPTAVFGAQLLLGQDRPWLPASLLGRPVAAPALGRILAVAGPWLDRLESIGRPRLGWAAGTGARRLLGLVSLVAALIVLIPIPGTNVLPSLSIVVVAIAVMRRDGLLVLLGAALGLAGLLVAVLAAGLLVEAARWLWATL
jgi:hypothetical protein